MGGEGGFGKGGMGKGDKGKGKGKKGNDVPEILATQNLSTATTRSIWSKNRENWSHPLDFSVV